MNFIHSANCENTLGSGGVLWILDGEKYF